MALVITNPRSLGIEFSTQFLGEFLRYRVVKTVSVSGYLLNLSNQSGVDGILDNLDWLGSGKGYGHNWTHLINRLAF